MTYYKLIDEENMNIVVRGEGESQQAYIKGRGWIESGILMEYFCDESPFYNEYEKISEGEALRLIESL